MRIISKKTKYCLRALYSLAASYGKGPTLISDLAEQEHIPKKFLEQILLALKLHDVVDSKTGRGGGYQLARSPEKITIGSVIRIMEGPLAPLACASETAYHPCEECIDVSTCGTRLLMRRVRDATAEILDHATLADVSALVERTKTRPDQAGRDYEESIIAGLAASGPSTAPESRATGYGTQSGGRDE
jgi:Rrf2 family protein